MLNPQILTDLLKQQLAPIQEWLDDKSVTEIMINPGGRVFVESRGVIEYKGDLLSENAIIMALTAIAKTVRQDAVSGTKDSIVTASIEDMRISGGMSPICPDGSFLTIRKHQDKSLRPSLEQLIHEKKAITREQADKLVDLVVHQKRNCIFAGGTGAGKTTLINAILNLIPPHERVLSIEDARELSFDLPNSYSLLTDPKIGFTAKVAVQLMLRQYPGRIVLGETRGDETFDLIRALNSGHSGSMSSIHADSAEQALDALEMLYQMSLPANASIPSELVRRYISKSVHVVVFVSRRNIVENGIANVKRGVEQIILVKGVTNEGKYDLEDIA